MTATAAPAAARPGPDTEEAVALRVLASRPVAQQSAPQPVVRLMADGEFRWGRAAGIALAGPLDLDRRALEMALPGDVAAYTALPAQTRQQLQEAQRIIRQTQRGAFPAALTAAADAFAEGMQSRPPTMDVTRAFVGELLAYDGTLTPLPPDDGPFAGGSLAITWSEATVALSRLRAASPRLHGWQIEGGEFGHGVRGLIIHFADDDTNAAHRSLHG